MELADGTAGDSWHFRYFISYAQPPLPHKNDGQTILELIYRMGASSSAI